MLGISTKLGAAAIGAAASTLLWTLLAAFVDEVGTRLGDTGLATVTGATATILGAVLGYLVPETAVTEAPQDPPPAPLP